VLDCWLSPTRDLAAAAAFFRNINSTRCAPEPVVTDKATFYPSAIRTCAPGRDMKLLTYDFGTGPRAGVLLDDNVVDISSAVGTLHTLSDVRAFLELPDSPIDHLRRVLARASVTEHSSGKRRAESTDPPAPHRARLHRLRRACIGPTTPATCNHLGWRSGRDCQSSTSRPRCESSDQTLRSRFRQLANSSIMSASWRPSSAVKASTCSSSRPTHVLRVSLSSTTGAHATSRPMRVSSGWVRPKARVPPRRSGPGSSLPTRSQQNIAMAPSNVDCKVRVNGELWMDGNAWNMRHTFGAMIERASQDSRIVPADVIASGTIGGGSIGGAIRKGISRSIPTAR